MKKIIMSVCSMMVLSVGIASADPAPTPITERTYADFNHGCFSSCNTATGHPTDPRWRYYCSCACDTAEAKCRVVVKKYQLQFEEQLEAVESEYLPNTQDLNMCRSKAGI